MLEQIVNEKNLGSLDNDVDTDTIMKEANHQFSFMKAQVNRLVARRDEFIIEIFDKTPVHFSILDGIRLNLKLKCEGKLAPFVMLIKHFD